MPTITMNMTPAERNQLAKFEKIIQRGMSTFVDVGKALLEIRTRLLYRDEYESFPDYCQERWGFTHGRARQLISAARVGEEAQKTMPSGGKGDNNVSPIPPNSGQQRILSQLPEDQRPAAWREVLDQTDNQPTAAVVREVVERWVERNESHVAQERQEIESQSTATEEAVAASPPEVQRELDEPRRHDRNHGSGPGGLDTQRPEEPESQEPRSQNGRLPVGVILANKAIGALMRIPKNDPLRKRGFQIVSDWISAHQ